MLRLHSAQRAIGSAARRALLRCPHRGCCNRGMASASAALGDAAASPTALVYERNGEPEEVLQLTTLPLRPLGDDEIVVELLAVRQCTRAHQSATHTRWGCMLLTMYRVMTCLFAQAPVNPSDVNTVQGVYPLKPDPPRVPGHEGVGQVLEVGSAVSVSHALTMSL